MSAEQEEVEQTAVLDPAGAALEVLNADEVARLLRVNRKTVYDSVERKEIPGARFIGGALRFHRATVLGWMASGQGRVSRSSRRPRR